MQINQTATQEVWVNVLAKGIITIPKKMRKQVGIKEGDVARIKLIDNKIIIESREKTSLKQFTKKEVQKWLKEDELSPELVNKIDELWPELP